MSRTPQRQAPQRRANPARAHSDEDIEDAIRALTPGHFKKLRAAAYALVRGLDLETAGRGHEDLYSEALARTLSGSRSWRQGVDFMYHLIQAMRSIAWTWREFEDRRERAGLVGALGAGTPEGGEDEVMDPVSPEPNIETAYLTSRELARFHRRFSDDRPASIVMHGWAQGESMQEMAQRFGIALQDLQWAARRIRRFSQRAAPEDSWQTIRQAVRQAGSRDRGDTHGQ